VLNLLVATLFLLSCLVPFINTKNWPVTGFLGLMVPYLVILLVLFILFWLVAKPRYALFSLVILIVGWKQIGVLLATASTHNFAKTKQAGNIRIVDWNVQSFNGLSKNKEVKKHIREEVAASVLKYKPDVICMQEFNHNYAGQQQADNLSLFSKEYPYHFFSRDYQRNGGVYASGCIIFSRLPIVDSGKVKYPGAESLIYVDVLSGTDTVRVFAMHLQSFKFKKEDYDDIEKIKSQEDENLAASRNIFKKMRAAFRRRGAQADIVRTEADKSPHPSVICGDFNDVPNSYTYFHIKGNRQDAFLQKQFGVGRTFISLAPTLRIDYILPTKDFEVQQFELVDEDLSDHLMLVSDLHLKK